MFLSDMSPWLDCCCYKITKKEIGFALHPRLPGGETFRNRVPNMNSINEFEAGSARGGFAAAGWPRELLRNRRCSGYGRLGVQWRPLSPQTHDFH